MLVMNLNNGCTEDTFKEVSLAISKKQLKEDLRKKGKDYYHTIRMELIEMGKLKPLKDNDTLFFLETYEYETGVFYGKIWNAKTSVSYSYKQGEFSFDENEVFTAFTCELIENWDVKTIRKEEKENSTMTSPFFIYGTRVVVEEKDIKVDCIGFNEFFSLDRDR